LFLAMGGLHPLAPSGAYTGAAPEDGGRRLGWALSVRFISAQPSPPPARGWSRLGS
jgi:hypothetical protein